MPTIILNEEDIKKMLDDVTDNRFNINHIVNMSVDNKKKELSIFWRH